MQQVTDEELAGALALKKSSMRLFRGEEMIENIKIRRVRYSAAAGGGGEFAIGTACGASATITVDGTGHGISGEYLSLRFRIGADKPWRPLLHGYVISAIAGTGSTQITIADIMQHRGGVNYAPAESVLDPCTLADALTDLAGQFGTELDAETRTAAAAFQLENGAADIPKSTTLQNAAGLMAGIMGGFAMINRDGKLAVKSFRDTHTAVPVYAGGHSTEEEPYIVSGLIMQRTEITETKKDSGTIREETDHEYSAGGMARSGGSFLTTANPLARQELTEQAWARLGPLELYGGDFSIPGGILMEPGDIVDMRTRQGLRKAAVTQMNLEWDGGCKTSVNAGGAPQMANAPKGPITRTLENLRGSIGGLWGSNNANVEAIEDTNQRILEDHNGLVAALTKQDGAPEDIVAGLENYVRYDLDSETAFAGTELAAKIGSEAEAKIGAYVVTGSDGKKHSIASMVADIIELQGDVNVEGNLTVNGNYIYAQTKGFWTPGGLVLAGGGSKGGPFSSIAFLTGTYHYASELNTAKLEVNGVEYAPEKITSYDSATKKFDDKTVLRQME